MVADYLTDNAFLCVIIRQFYHLQLVMFVVLLAILIASIVSDMIELNALLVETIAIFIEESVLQIVLEIYIKLRIDVYSVLWSAQLVQMLKHVILVLKDITYITLHV